MSREHTYQIGEKVNKGLLVLYIREHCGFSNDGVPKYNISFSPDGCFLLAYEDELTPFEKPTKKLWIYKFFKGRCHYCREKIAQDSKEQIKTEIGHFCCVNCMNAYFTEEKEGKN